MINLGLKRGAKVIRIVVDKPAYLPRPRDLLHENRTDKTGKLNVDECTIGDDHIIPQGRKYQQMLANAILKQKFISYLMKQFVKFGSDSHMPVHIILDIHQGGRFDLPMLKEQEW